MTAAGPVVFVGQVSPSQPLPLRKVCSSVSSQATRVVPAWVSWVAVGRPRGTPILKAGGEMLNTGSLQFLFGREAVIQFERKEGQDLEEIEPEFIDHGLEELEENEGTVFYTNVA